MDNLTVQQFSEMIRTDPNNYYNTSDELIDGFTKIIQDKIGPNMKKVVLEMPKTPVM